VPKINLYLPDDLADAVKEAGVPVSAICQRSLEQAVRRVADVRAAVAGELAPEDALGRLTQLTQRTRQALTLAIEQVQADGTPALDTGHILGGILSEGTNLALHVLRAVDVDLDRLASDLGPRPTAEPLPADADDGARRFSVPAGAGRTWSGRWGRCAPASCGRCTACLSASRPPAARVRRRRRC
jgi:hypothetical protein